MRSNCVVCGDVLLKRIRQTSEGVMHLAYKDVAAYDMNYPTGTEEVEMVWCVTCDLLYRHE